MNTIKVSLNDLFICLSHAQDLINPELAMHHRQVAFLAYQMAIDLKLTQEEQNDILLAGLLHDIGALALNEFPENTDDTSDTIFNHGYAGFRLLSGFNPLEKVAEIIRYHHHPWRSNGHINNKIPLTSHIIHIAEISCGFLDKSKLVLPQLPALVASVESKSNTSFSPQLIDCLRKLCTIEHIWLSLVFKPPIDHLSGSSFPIVSTVDIDQLVYFSKMFSRIIDFRSEFTARHSAGVAETAKTLAQLTGYSEYECKMIRIAGYLHDLGKLAVDKSILEKPGPLTSDELNVMKMHPFNTYRVLEVVNGFETISEWAAYHHESPNGQGYPYHLDDSNLPLGSKIIAAADVFTALIENRPYRKSMKDYKIREVLISMADEQSLSPTIIKTLLNNFLPIKRVCTEELDRAEVEFLDFRNGLPRKD